MTRDRDQIYADMVAAAKAAFPDATDGEALAHYCETPAGRKAYDAYCAAPYSRPASRSIPAVSSKDLPAGAGPAERRAYERIETEAEALVAADPRLSFAEAVTQVATREPQLYSEYIGAAARDQQQAAGDRAYQAIEAKAEALVAADPRLAFAEAVEQVATREPHLYREYLTAADLDQPSTAAPAPALRQASEAGADLADLAATHRGGQGRAADGPYRLFMVETRLAEAPARVPYLPRPGTYKHPKWGTIRVTAERLQRFVDNFAQGVYQRTVPLDAEHETKLSGAVAWIKRLVRNDEGGVDAEVEWTDRGRAFLAADRFKYISPEWYDEWTDPATGRSYRDVVIGGAITTRPFFKEGALRPLVASERGLEVLPAPAPARPRRTA